MEISFYAALPLLVLLMERPFMGRTREAKIRSELILLAVLFAGAILFRVLLRTTEGARPRLEPLLHARRATSTGSRSGCSSPWRACGWVACSAHPRQFGSWRSCRHCPGSWPPCCSGRSRRRWASARRFPQAYTSEEWLYEHIFYGAIAFFLLLPAVFGDSLGGLPRVILRNRVLAWLGLISYGIFLWHHPIVGELSTRDWGEWRFAGMTLATFVIATACAAASYYLLERPAAALQGPLTEAAEAGIAG